MTRAAVTVSAPPSEKGHIAGVPFVIDMGALALTLATFQDADPGVGVLATIKRN
jgi:hypothetical protein